MKTIKKILLFTGLTLFSISCTKFLDEEGYNIDYTYYKTAEGVEALVVSCYQQTRWAVIAENQYPIEDMGTDLWMLGGDGPWRDAFGQFTSNSLTPTQSIVKQLWDNNFKGISNCNLAYEYVNKNTALDAATRAQRKGEVLFLRAYYYYELAIQYGDMPLINEFAFYPKTDFVRVPQKQIWSQIISDARQAYDLLNWANVDGKVMDDYGRVGKGAAGHLLAKAYMFRYCDKYAKNQSDGNMNEDRGGQATDIDSVIYYASQVCNYGAGAGNGSLHALASDYSTLWGWDQKTGLVAEYAGPEILFSINFSNNLFYDNVDATNTNGGNWQHMFYVGQIELYPLTTKLEDGSTATWGNTVGLVRDYLTDRPWRRLAPTPFYYSEDGLYAAKYYQSGKLGKLVDARLYKSHVWVFYCNDTKVDVPVHAYSNGAGSFNPSDIGLTDGQQRYGVGDTAILLSIEDVSKRFANGTKNEKLALARAKEKYWYVPMQSIKVPSTRGEVGEKDVTTNQFPPLCKFLDSRRAGIQDQGCYRNFYRMRLAETYLLLSEAYARKGNWSDAANTLNMVRIRAAWKEGEVKYCQFWKYDGGSYADRTMSTENDMKVNEIFLSSMTDAQITDFYVDETGRETSGELNRFDVLVRYGADYWYNKVSTNDYWTRPEYGGNIQKFHRFRPIPRSYSDALIPPDPHPQNYGY
jgi:starch-binding outer membrane protein, SusD/RagB family